MYGVQSHDDVTTLKRIPYYWSIAWDVSGGFPSQESSDTDFLCLFYLTLKTPEQTDNLPVI